MIIEKRLKRDYYSNIAFRSGKFSYNTKLSNRNIEIVELIGIMYLIRHSEVILTNSMTQPSKMIWWLLQFNKICVPICLFEEFVAYNYFSISKLEQLEPFLNKRSLFDLLTSEINVSPHFFVWRNCCLQWFCHWPIRAISSFAWMYRKLPGPLYYLVSSVSLYYLTCHTISLYEYLSKCNSNLLPKCLDITNNCGFTYHNVIEQHNFVLQESFN